MRKTAHRAHPRAMPEAANLPTEPIKGLRPVKAPRTAKSSGIARRCSRADAHDISWIIHLKGD
jgi:hypothetical protein